MKRHQSIVTLSREHHVGLLFCWKIRQAIAKQVPGERIVQYIKYFWHSHLLEHFAEEETILFAMLQDSLVEQAVAEHTRIRLLVEAILAADSPGAEQLGMLSATLDDHIRFEERVLFPHLERELSEEQLDGVRQKLLQSHSADRTDRYSDEFWTYE